LSLIKKTPAKDLKLRVFAGPNGSGKSTVIKQVRLYKSGGIPIDFGYYVNADDISVALNKNGFSFQSYKINVVNEEFQKIAIASGLINKDFTVREFSKSYLLIKNKIILQTKAADGRLAQIIADFLRKKLLTERKRFSFETVFSHESKLEIMKQAIKAGYKVYLYFVSTESPEINKYRVDLRKRKGGHDVPPEKIESRYFRSLELLYDACQLSYQVFFFDNSEEEKPFKMFAHFKKSGIEKKWDDLSVDNYPEWFKTYYSKKVPR